MTSPNLTFVLTLLAVHKINDVSRESKIWLPLKHLDFILISSHKNNVTCYLKIIGIIWYNRITFIQICTILGRTLGNTAHNPTVKVKSTQPSQLTVL